MESKPKIVNKVPSGVKTYIILMTKACKTHNRHLSSQHIEIEHGIRTDVMDEMRNYDEDKTIRKKIRYHLKGLIRRFNEMVGVVREG